jgi:serine/threonine-protein kinase
VKAGHRIGDWVAVRPIGAGGMGQVWVAQHTDGRLGALKVMRGDSEPGEHERFEREVEVLGQLRHRSIVQLLDRGIDADAPWMVMEFVEGGNLEEQLLRGEAMGLEEALELFAGIADGLRQAHAQGIHHRDVKAENVVVASDGSGGKLVDFGVALKKGASRLTSAGFVMGTFAYLPPEVLQGGERDPALGDVYAVGQLLYEVLTGKLAFRGAPGESSTRRKWAALMADKLDSAALDPGEGFPDALRALVRGATEPEPGDRFGSMAVLADGLLALVDADTRERMAMPAPVPTAAPTPRKKGSLQISPLMVLVAALIGLGTVSCASVGFGVVSGLAAVFLLD